MSGEVGCAPAALCLVECRWCKACSWCTASPFTVLCAAQRQQLHSACLAYRPRGLFRGYSLSCLLRTCAPTLSANSVEQVQSQQAVLRNPYYGSLRPSSTIAKSATLCSLVWLYFHGRCSLPPAFAGVMSLVFDVAACARVACSYVGALASAFTS